MQTLSIPVSETIFAIADMDEEEMVATMRSEFALKMFHDAKMSLEQCADFCGTDIYDFMSRLADAGIPVINYSPEALEREVALFPAL